MICLCLLEETRAEVARLREEQQQSAAERESVGVLLQTSQQENEQLRQKLDFGENLCTTLPDPTPLF